MNATSTSTAELARLNWRLGLAYAEAVLATLKRHNVKLDLIGCHGQTLYHQPRAEKYPGRKFACTWQAGEAQVIAATWAFPWSQTFAPRTCWPAARARRSFRCSITCSLPSDKRGRVLQNIGGIANLTAIPAGAARRSSDCFRLPARQHGDRCAGAAAFP